MKTYVWLTFAFLGWGYYEASGGADFKPGAASMPQTAQVAAAGPKPIAAAIAPRGDMRIERRVEAALLTALRDTSGARNNVHKASLQPVAFRAETDMKDFAPVRPVVLDTSTPRDTDTAEPEIGIASAVTESAPKSSLRPVLRPGTPEADVGTPRISTRGSDNDVASHQISVPRANLRLGPGTNFPVLEALTQGTRVRFLREGDDGWVKLKAVEDGRIGWMAGYLIAER